LAGRARGSLVGLERDVLDGPPGVASILAF